MLPALPGRWLRRLLYLVAGLFLLAGTILVLLQIPSVATWAGRRLAGLAPLAEGTRLHIERVSGSWIGGLTLHGVVLEREGRRLAAIRVVRASYDPRRLLGADRRLEALVVEGARLHARREGGGWDIARAFRTSDDTTAAGGSFAVDRLILRDVALVAELAPDSVVRIDGLELVAGDLVLADPPTLTIDSLSARLSPPTTPSTWMTLVARGGATPEVFRLDPVRLTGERSRIAGRLVLPRRLDDERIVDQLEVELSASPLALGDLAAIVPAVAPEGELELEVRAHAEGGRAVGRLTGRLDNARFTFDGSTRLGPDAPVEYQVTGEVRGLDPSRLAAAAPAGRINADVTADLRGPALDRADGTAALRLRDSRMGATDVRDLRFRAELVGGRADTDLRSTLGEGRVRLTGWVRPFDSIPTYRLAGRATRLPGTDSVVALLSGRDGEPWLEVGLRVSGAGFSADEATASGRITLTAVRAGAERTDLGGATVEVAERRLEARPELRIAGGRVAAMVTGQLGDPVAYEVRRGVLEHIDLGRLLGDTVAAPVSGRFTLTGRGTAPAEATVRASLALDEVRYGERRLDEATATLALDGGRATLALNGRLQGGRAAVRAEGRPFDSTPTFTLHRARLDRVDLGTLLARPDLAGPFSARLSGEGRWGGATRELRGRLAIEPSRLGEIDVHGGELAVTLAADRLRYDGALVTSAGALAAAGDGRPLDAVPTFAVRRGRADSVDLGALLGRPGLATRLDARFDAEAAGTAPDSMRARLGLDLLPSRINQTELRGGRAALTLDRGALEGEIGVDGEDGDLVARMRGTTAGPQRRLRVEGALRAERLARWTGDSTRDGALAARFTLDGAADSAGLLALAGTVTADGWLDSVRLDTLQIALSPGHRVLRVDTVVVRSNVAALDGGGRLALGPDGSADTLRLSGVLRDPMPLVALAGADSASLDSARLRLTATGPPGRRRVAVEGAAHRLLYAGHQVERIALAGAADLDSAGLAGAAGSVELEGGTIGPVVVLEARLAGRYDSIVSLRAGALLSDSIAIDAALRGAVAGDTLRGTLDRLDMVEGGRRWALERPTGFEVRPRRVAVDYFALRAGASRLAIDGAVDGAGTSDLALELRGFDLSPLQALGLSPFAGQAEGNLRLTGPADGPSLVGGMLVTVRPENGEETGRIGGRIAWTARGLDLDAAAAHADGSRLTVAGTLPLRLTLAPEDTASAVGVTRTEGDTLGLVVRADTFDLGFFEPFLPEDAAERLAGTLAVDGRIAGTMERPRAEGTVAIDNFGVNVPALGLRYEQGELAGRLSGDHFALERLRLVTDNDGELTATGTLRLAPLTDPALDIDAELREFRVSSSATLRTIASGQLRLDGTLAEPVLTGSLTLGRTDIYSGDGTAAAANVEEVELGPEDLQQLARDFGPAVMARAQEQPGLVERFRLDLDVRLPNRVWFRQRGSLRADIEVAGRVQVRQEPGEEMGFFGEVQPVAGRGFLELYGREFRVQEGEIRLAGPVEDLVLDVTAQYQVLTQADPGDDGILIDVNAAGRPDSLELEFTSDPAMSQEDIVSYIVTGGPASQNPLARQDAGEGPGAAETGAQMALSGLSESVAGAAGEALGLDVFQIRQDGLRGLTLTAGRYISSRLFLSLQQPIQLSGDAGRASSAAGPGFELEYAARRWLRANLRGGNVPPRFFFRGRHAF
ncbi:MAG TPA: translocation/assembly module TamB domain-containing protein [Gemmatimonadales bacterium]|nr:translocation/assembly module TamB domain-containing protein [Gemmatimonadales bacterium]